MNKNQEIFIAVALTLLFTGIALATSTALSATSDVIIYAFNSKPRWIGFRLTGYSHQTQ